MAKQLEDIGKEAKDLLSQDFPSNGSIKITTQAKNSENVTVKSTLSRYVKREKVSREIICATYEEKYENKQHNLELNGKITTNNEYNGTVTLKDLIGSGSKIELHVHKTPDSLTASPTVTYKTDSVAIKTKLVYPISSEKKSALKLFVDAGFLGSNLYGGIGTTITLDAPKAAIDIEGVASYTDKRYQLTAKAKHNLQTNIMGFGLSYFYKLASRTTLAVEVTSDTTLEKFNLTAGAQKKLDKFTTLKGKAFFKHSKKDTEIRSGLALKQHISPSILATFGVDLNLPLLFGQEIGEPHSYGAEFKFENK